MFLDCIPLSSVRQKKKTLLFNFGDRKSCDSEYCKNPLNWEVGVNERAEGRKKELKKIQAPHLQMFSKCRGKKTCRSRRSVKRRGKAAPAADWWSVRNVTSVLVMCNAAWVINQLQGSEGSLYSIQNNTFSVHFENSEPCFTSGAKLQLLTQDVSRPYACFRDSCMIANPPVPSSGTHSTQCNKKKSFVPHL